MAVKLVGTTIQETFDAFGRAKFGPRKQKEAPTGDQNDRIKAVGRLIVAILLIGVGTYCVALNQGQSQTLGVSILSAVVGYWVK